MAKITKSAIEEYVTGGGRHCPRCKSQEIEATDALDSDVDAAWQPVSCPNCGLTWTDYYKIYSVEIDSTDNNGMVVEVENG